MKRLLLFLISVALLAGCSFFDAEVPLDKLSFYFEEAIGPGETNVSTVLTVIPNYGDRALEVNFERKYEVLPDDGQNLLNIGVVGGAHFDRFIALWPLLEETEVEVVENVLFSVEVERADLAEGMLYQFEGEDDHPLGSALYNFYSDLSALFLQDIY